MDFEFSPLDYQDIEIDNKDIIQIFGKTLDGKTICVLDYTKNFFYVITENEEKIKKMLEKENLDYETAEKNYLGKKVDSIRVYCLHRKIKETTEKIKIHDKSAIVLEKDINSITRYIIEKNLKPLFTYKISGQVLNNSDEFSGLDKSLDVDFVLKLDKILEESEKVLKPKVIALDIETEKFEIGKGKILMIALVSDKFKKVLTWKTSKSRSKASCIDYKKGTP